MNEQFVSHKILEFYGFSKIYELAGQSGERHKTGEFISHVTNLSASRMCESAESLAVEVQQVYIDGKLEWEGMGIPPLHELALKHNARIRDSYWTQEAIIYELEAVKQLVFADFEMGVE